jgi:hypothetical protein
MAASIKMDELLVTWLSSDNVYENVLNLIETFRQEEANGTNTDENNNTNVNGTSSSETPQSPMSSPRRKSSKRGTSTSDAYNNGKSPQSSSSPYGMDPYNQHNEFDDPPNAKNKVTIPPFYRPPGIYNHTGQKMKSIRRSRSDSFDSDQSWDGIYSVDSTTSSSSDPKKENTDDGNINTNANANANANAKTEKSNIPVKEQVKNIFEEHGKSIKQSKSSSSLSSSPSSSKTNPNTNQHQSKYLTIDNFVKITKDICNFPTFFNKPLYKRILYLWNTQDVKSKRGKLIIWNEYYLNNVDDLDIGVDPDDANGTGTNANNESSDDNKGEKDGDGNNGSAKKKKKKTNDLLDQLDKFITYDIFKWYWTQEMEDYDLSERFFRLLKKPHEDFVGKDDFSPFIKELLNDHPVSCFCFVFDCVLFLFFLFLGGTCNYIFLHPLLSHTHFFMNIISSHLQNNNNDNIPFLHIHHMNRALNFFPTMPNFKTNTQSPS